MTGARRVPCRSAMVTSGIRGRSWRFCSGWIRRPNRVSADRWLARPEGLQGHHLPRHDGGATHRVTPPSRLGCRRRYPGQQPSLSPRCQRAISCTQRSSVVPVAVHSRPVLADDGLSHGCRTRTCSTGGTAPRNQAAGRTSPLRWRRGRRPRRQRGWRRSRDAAWRVTLSGLPDCRQRENRR